MESEKNKWTKIAYVAGPYRAASEYLVSKNIMAAEEIGVKLWYYGFVVIIPHKNTAYFGGAYSLPDSVWLQGDLEIIKRCDLLVVAPAWQFSSGTKSEIALAEQIGIPVYYWSNEQDRLALCYYYKED